MKQENKQKQKKDQPGVFVYAVCLLTRDYYTKLKLFFLFLDVHTFFLCLLQLSLFNWEHGLLCYNTKGDK